MNHSTPGLPVHHKLPEFTQTQVHRLSDAIRPSHPLSSPSLPAPIPSRSESFPMSQLFAWGGQSIGVSASASVLPMNIQDWSPILHPGKGCFLGAWPGPRRHACALLLTVLRRWASSRRWLDQLPDVGKWRRRMTKTLRRSFFWCERIKEKKKEWKRHNFY